MVCTTVCSVRCVQQSAVCTILCNDCFVFRRHLPGELLDLVRQEVAHSCNPHKYIAAADV